MKLSKSLIYFLLLAIIISQSQIQAQEKSTVYLGMNTSFLTTADSELLNSDIGFNLGYFQPLWINERNNIGFNVYGQYGAAKDNFENLDNRFSILPQEGTTSITTSNEIQQSLLQLGVGPQANIKIGQAFWISPIFQIGYFNFKQDEIILSQHIEFPQEGDSQTFQSDVLVQDELIEDGFFLRPTIQLSYELNGQWSLWGSINYFIAEVNVSQRNLVPLGEPDDQGAYFVDQIVGSQNFSNVSKDKNLKGLGVSFGVAYSFGSSTLKAQDYNSSRSNKPRTRSSDTSDQNPIAATSNQTADNRTTKNESTDGNILCGKTDHFIHDGDCDDDDAERTPQQVSKILDHLKNNNNDVQKAQDYNAARSNKPTSIAADPDEIISDTIQKAQDYNAARSNKPTSRAPDQGNPLYTSKETPESVLVEGESNDGNGSPTLCGETNHLAHVGGGDCDDDDREISPWNEKSSINGNVYGIQEVHKGIFIIYNKLNLLNSKASKKDITVGQDSTNNDSGQAKTQNPYFVSNEMAGEMFFYNKPSNGIPSVEFKRLIKIDDVAKIERQKYLLYKNGNTYSINLNERELDKLFNQIKSVGNFKESSTCPPESNPSAQCKFIDGFCFCRL